MSINQLSLLTGRSRQHVTRRVARLNHVDGKRGAKLYDSEEAIPVILAVSELEQLRAEASRERALLNKARQEVIDGTRIPIEFLMEETEKALQTMVARLKATQGKALTDERIDWVLEEFRKLPEKIKRYPRG